MGGAYLYRVCGLLAAVDGAANQIELRPWLRANLFCIELPASGEWKIDVLKPERQRLPLKKLWNIRKGAASGVSGEVRYFTPLIFASISVVQSCRSTIDPALESSTLAEIGLSAQSVEQMTAISNTNDDVLSRRESESQMSSRRCRDPS
jgi:hypothetical protein